MAEALPDAEVPLNNIELDANTPELHLVHYKTHVMDSTVNSIDYAQNGALVVASSGENIDIFSLISDSLQTSFNCNETGSEHVHFISNDKILFNTTTAEMYPRLVDADSGRIIMDYNKKSKVIDSIAMLKHTNTFAISTSNEKICVFDQRCVDAVAETEMFARGVLAIHPGGELIAAANAIGVFMYDIRCLEQGTLMGHIPSEQYGQLSDVCFSPDGEYIAVPDIDCVDLLLTNQLQPLHKYRCVSNDVSLKIAAAFNADSRILFTGNIAGSINLWNVKHTTIAHTLKEQQDNTAPVQLIKQNPLLMNICSVTDCTLNFWHLEKEFVDQFLSNSTDE